MASIENKGPNKWLLVVSDGFDYKGKRNKFTKMFHGSEKQAKKEAILFESEVKRGKYNANSKITFAQFVEDWRRDYADTDLKPTTLQWYNAMLDQRILPLIGNKQLREIRPQVIKRMLNSIAKEKCKNAPTKTLSPATVRHHYSCLSAVLSVAVQWEILEDNPCCKMTVSKPKTKIDCYDRAEAIEMLKILEKEKTIHRALVYMAITSGARRGELMGLEWEPHFDFDNYTITVEQASQYIYKIGVITDTPKTDTSTATIAMPKNVMEFMAALKAEQEANKKELGDLWIDSGRVFVSPEGRPLHPHWPTTWWRRFLIRNNLRRVSFHSLRHLSATLLIEMGIPLPNISERLRHSDVSTTADIYAHSIKEIDRTAATKLGELPGLPGINPVDT